jgi:hypothetical protein
MSALVDTGVYESLLTAKLYKRLSGDNDLRPGYGSVDEAEQALAIALHLAPIIEKSLRVAGTAEGRAELTRRILAVLPDIDAHDEALRPIEDGRITRLEEVATATALRTTRLARPATPFSDTALMTNARNEPTSRPSYGLSSPARTTSICCAPSSSGKAFGCSRTNSTNSVGVAAHCVSSRRHTSAPQTLAL